MAESPNNGISSQAIVSELCSQTSVFILWFRSDGHSGGRTAKTRSDCKLALKMSHEFSRMFSPLPNRLAILVIVVKFAANAAFAHAVLVCVLA